MALTLTCQMNDTHGNTAPPLPKIRTVKVRLGIKLNPNFWERGLGGEGQMTQELGRKRWD